MNMNEEERTKLEKAIDLIGKDIYMIEKPYQNRPYIVSMRVLSLEISGWKMQFNGANKVHSATYGYYPTREEAEKALQEQINESTVHIDPLLPCPVCGGRAEIKEYSCDYIVRCSECGLQTEAHRQMKVAIKRWNERKQKAE